MGTWTAVIRSVNGTTRNLNDKVIIYSTNQWYVTLDDVFQNPQKNGIISYLSSRKDLPISSVLNEIIGDDIALNFDMEYIYNKSGKKKVSSLIMSLLENREEISDTFPLTNEQMETLSHIINNRYTFKWQRLYDIYKTNYDAMSPYDMSIDEESSDTLDTKSKSTNSSTDQSNFFGYNDTSDDGVPQSRDINTTERTDEYNRTNPKTRTITRKGNIGNITKQELIEKERNVLKWQMWDIIYGDLDNILTCGTYLLRG